MKALRVALVAGVMIAVAGVGIGFVPAGEAALTRGANAPGYFVGGKTGTALKPNPNGRGYSTDRRVSAFVGAFPMHAPRYAVYFMVDEPRPRADTGPFATAGVVSAPATRRVVERVGPILGLVPETERAAEIEQALHLPLQPPRPRAPATAPATPPTASPPMASSRPPATRPAPAIAPLPAETAPIRRTALPEGAFQKAEGRHAPR